MRAFLLLAPANSSAFAIEQPPADQANATYRLVPLPKDFCADRE
jgi:hypothetical protein